MHHVVGTLEELRHCALDRGVANARAEFEHLHAWRHEIGVQPRNAQVWRDALLREIAPAAGVAARHQHVERNLAFQGLDHRARVLLDAAVGIDRMGHVQHARPSRQAFALAARVDALHRRPQRVGAHPRRDAGRIRGPAPVEEAAVLLARGVQRLDLSERRAARVVHVHVVAARDLEAEVLRAHGQIVLLAVAAPVRGVEGTRAIEERAPHEHAESHRGRDARIRGPARPRDRGGDQVRAPRLEQRVERGKAEERRVVGKRADDADGARAVAAALEALDPPGRDFGVGVQHHHVGGGSRERRVDGADEAQVRRILEDARVRAPGRERMQQRHDARIGARIVHKPHAVARGRVARERGETAHEGVVAVVDRDDDLGGRGPRSDFF